MNEQQQAIFFFLEQLNLNSGFKVKTKGAKSTVTISQPDVLENIVKALSCTLKVHTGVTVSCVDLLTDSVNFTVTLANKA